MTKSPGQDGQNTQGRLESAYGDSLAVTGACGSRRTGEVEPSSSRRMDRSFASSKTLDERTKDLPTGAPCTCPTHAPHMLVQKAWRHPARDTRKEPDLFVGSPSPGISGLPQEDPQSSALPASRALPFPRSKGSPQKLDFSFLLKFLQTVVE